MNNRTFYLNRKQYLWLANNLPQPKPSGERIPLKNEELLNGILYVLKTGCRWQDIPREICHHDSSTCWRRLNFWRKHGGIIEAWQDVLVALDETAVLDLSLGSVDGSLVPSPRFKSGTGYSGKHHRTGTNVLLTIDLNGLPLSTHAIKGI